MDLEVEASFLGGRGGMQSCGEFLRQWLEKKTGIWREPVKEPPRVAKSGRVSPTNVSLIRDADHSIVQYLRRFTEAAAIKQAKGQSGVRKSSVAPSAFPR